MLFHIGDIVTRESYKNDTFFRIIDIVGETAYLKGINLRLYADSELSDLNKVENKKIEDDDAILSRVDKEIQLDRSEYFYLPGKVLHVDGDEEYVDALKRNLYTETGIVLDSKDSIEPFYEVRYYNRDYKGSGMNRLSDLIYFVVKTDKLPNHKKLKLTDKELAEKLPLEVIRRSAFGKELREYIENEENPLNKVKAKELLLAYDKYKEIYKF